MASIKTLPMWGSPKATASDVVPIFRTPPSLALGSGGPIWGAQTVETGVVDAVVLGDWVGTLVVVVAAWVVVAGAELVVVVEDVPHEVKMMTPINMMAPRMENFRIILTSSILKKHVQI
jgi:hypothetical protein